MTDETRPVWFTLVDKAMPHVQSGFMTVELSMPCTIKQFKVAVEEECVGLVEGIKVLLMNIYPKINDDNTFSNPLCDRQFIGDYGKSAETGLFVTQQDQGTMSVKKPRLDSTWIPPLQDINYDQAEFDLDDLLNVEKNRDRLVSTPRLNRFFEDCGEFPLWYYVRTEEAMFWKSVKNVIMDNKPKKAVLLGSPGVGKSCFLMLMGFYMAFYKQKEVLIFRKAITYGMKNTAIYVDGESKKGWKLSNVSKLKLSYLLDETCRNALLFVDGYTQNEVVTTLDGLLLQFHVLATSCQYDAKASEESKLIVLPAWRFENILSYAKLTDWTVDTGSVETKERSLRKRVKEQYYYSGGSLREFCKPRGDLIDRVESACRILSDAQALQLLYNHQGHRSGDQIDRLRRHYVTDHNNVDHFTRSHFWTVSVDSGFALKLLGQHVSADKLLEVYQFARTIGAGFHGIAYELYFHHVVRQATAMNSSVVVTMPDCCKYHRIEIRPQTVDCQGQNEAECYAYLEDKLTESTYWHPDYAFFPFINAVAICDAYQRGHDEPEKIVAFIQVTIQDHKTFKVDHWSNLCKAVDSNQNVDVKTFVFVVVRPKSSDNDQFTLRDSPDPTTVETTHGFFEI
ncbi:hypothetical protein AC1031_002449 [Aphanomyces cochlioides]|nr:hypothetical protein AC1031_002449 [Aphanomyces cochlioides]